MCACPFISSNSDCHGADVRPPLLGDVVAAARVLLPLPAERRAALLSELLRQATVAEQHRLRTGRSHPDHGDGSLMAAALAHGCAREPSLRDGDYCKCLALVLIRLAGPGATDPCR